MKLTVPAIFVTILCLSMPVLVTAQVADDSENFLLEEAQAAEELPIAQEDTALLAQDAEESDDEDAAMTSNLHRHHRRLSSRDTGRNIDLVNTVQSLQKEVQELRGQLEMQAHNLDELKKLQYEDGQELHSSLNHPTTDSSPNDEKSMNNQPQPSPSSIPNLWSEEARHPVDPKTANQANPIRLNPADEQISYLAAYDLIKHHNFPKAFNAFQEFLLKYPQGGYSANAHYWLGDLYLAKQDYPAAIHEFQIILDNFKSSSKYAPSRLKLSYALADSGHYEEAKQHLHALITLYPDTATALSAQAKLEQLGG